MKASKQSTRDEVVGAALMSLPLPAESSTFFDQLRERVGEQKAEQKRGHGLPFLSSIPLRRQAVAIAVILSAVFVGAALGAVATRSSANAFSSPVLWFQPAAGWNVVVTNVPPPQIENLQIAWSSNVPVAGDDAATTWPMKTVKTLPSDGIVVYASLARQVDEAATYRERQLPLRLSDGYFLSSGYENQPTPNISVQIIYARVKQQYLLVHIWFGANEPTDAMLTEAQEQLGRLSVPNVKPLN